MDPSILRRFMNMNLLQRNLDDQESEAATPESSPDKLISKSVSEKKETLNPEKNESISISQLYEGLHTKQVTEQRKKTVKTLKQKSDA